MNILIVGAGVVGVALAEQFSLEGHRVAVIERNRQIAMELKEKLDIMAVYGNASSPSVLLKAGIKTMDMVIAVTDADEVNLVVGMLASRFGVKHRIVRIRNREYMDDDCVLPLKELGIDHIINPEPTIVEALDQMIKIPGTTSITTLADGQVLLLGFDIEEDSPIVGRTLAEIGKAGDLDNFLILYVIREDEIIVPKGHHEIQAGDKVHVLVSAQTYEFVLPIIHKRSTPTKEVIITGASRISMQLAESLQGVVNRIVLIDPDPQFVEEAAHRLKKVTVLKGKETDLDVLEEASIDKCDLFCALSYDDSRNMLASLLAKKNGAAKVAVLVQQPEYISVLDSLGVEIVINPRLVTVGEILMHVRRGLIHSVTRLEKGSAEIIEMQAPADCPAVKAPIKNLKFPKNALIGAIMKDDMMQIPTGDTRIEPGQNVVVFALPDAIPQIEKLFNKRK